MPSGWFLLLRFWVSNSALMPPSGILIKENYVIRNVLPKSHLFILMKKNWPYYVAKSVNKARYECLFYKDFIVNKHLNLKCLYYHLVFLFFLTSC